MTRHPVKLEQLPPDLRDGRRSTSAAASTGRRASCAREVFRALPRRARAAARGREARRDPVPAAAVHRLQGRVARVPRVGAASSSAATRCWSSSGTASWLDDDNRDETLAFLERLGATHVIVDAPKVETRGTSSRRSSRSRRRRSYVRFHGRNAATWNKRGGGAAERFDYLYSEDELARVGRAAARAGGAGRTRHTRSSTTTTSTAGPEAAAGSRRPRRTRRRSGRLLEEEGGRHDADKVGT